MVTNRKEYHDIIRLYPKGIRRTRAARLVNKMSREGFVKYGNYHAYASAFVMNY